MLTVSRRERERERGERERERFQRERERETFENPSKRPQSILEFLFTVSIVIKSLSHLEFLRDKEQTFGTSIFFFDVVFLTLQVKRFQKKIKENNCGRPFVSIGVLNYRRNKKKRYEQRNRRGYGKGVEPNT